MSASVASTSASADFKSDPKAFLKKITEALESLSKNDVEIGKWKKINPKAVDTLKAQLPKLKSTYLTEGVTDDSLETMEHMWANLELDKPQPNVSTLAFSESNTFRQMHSNKSSEKKI